MPRKKVTENKICQNCGEVNNINDLYCSNCGHDLQENVEVKNKQNEVNLKINDNISNHPKNKNNAFLYFLGSVLFVLLGAVGMYFYLDFTDNTSNINDNVIKNVNITDSGIAFAVSRVYDSVVVVENYKDDNLISTGTGFVYKKDKKYGYILTNNHVIDDGSKIYVTFTNGTRCLASVIGTDAYSDVALLKVSAKSVISVAVIGKNSDVRLGDTAFAIGAPLDYQVYSWSVTRGIISGKNRLVEVSLNNSRVNDYVMEVIQTDTAINAGNSGGPLCNGKGEVIGITNMKLASSQVEGMGFAIPIEKAIEYADIFLSGKKVTRPYLGISMYDLSSLLNSFYHYNINTDLKYGIYIESVEKNSCAEKSGLRKGDIITQIDDVEIKSSAYLRYILYEHKVGDKIEVTYYRNNKKMKTTIKLGSNTKTL